MRTLLAVLFVCATEAAVADATRCDLPQAHLHARLAGAVVDELDWSGSQMGCDGMPRADGGIRLRFTGRGRSGPVDVVFGVPALAEGASGRALPVNLTLILGGGRVFGTRGADRCTLDEVRQTPLTDAAGARRWRVNGRGFCLAPARAVGADDAVLVSTFEFTGVVARDADGNLAP